MKAAKQVVIRELGWGSAVALTFSQWAVSFLFLRHLGDLSFLSAFFLVAVTFVFGRIIRAQDEDETALHRLAFQNTLLNFSLVVGALLLQTLAAGLTSDGAGATGLLFFELGMLGIQGMLHFALTVGALRVAGI